MIVLDTDHLSCLEWGSAESANLRIRLAEASDQIVVVSIASYEEQMHHGSKDCGIVFVRKCTAVDS